MPLIGCPFCREMFSDEEATHCPVCGMSLSPIEKLPLSYEARVALAAELAAIAPEDRPVPWWYFRRGRGALTILAVSGIVVFFLPWILLHKPDEAVFTGYDLARSRGGWFFGGAIAWFVMLPLVVSRRTVYKMRGVRIITATFAALNLIEASMLLLRPPHGNRYFPIQFDWGYGLYATAALGALGVLFGAFFGGRLDDIDARELEPEPAPDLSPEHDESRTLH